MKQHTLKVYEAPSFLRVPQIRLQGKWVEEAGFRIGSPIQVDVGEGELKISLVPVESVEEVEESTRPRRRRV